MLEVLAMAGGPWKLGDLGPGPKRLRAGDERFGYFGIASEDELFQNVELSIQLDFQAGHSLQPIEWLKFVENHRIFYVPKRPIRYGVSWDQLYQNGLVYGVNSPGPNPGTNAETNQLRLLEKDGRVFRIRLIKGVVYPDDPEPPVDPDNPDDPPPAFDWQGTLGVNDHPVTHGSEWNRWIYRMLSFRPGSQEGRNWEQFVASDMSFNAAGEWSHVQELRPDEDGLSFVRGGGRGDDYTHTTSSNTGNQHGWRPVLELVDPDEFLLPVMGPQQDLELLKEPMRLTVVDDTNWMTRVQEPNYRSMDGIFPVGAFDHTEEHIDQPWDVGVISVGYRSERPYDGLVLPSDNLRYVGGLEWDESHLEQPWDVEVASVGYRSERPYDGRVADEDGLFEVGGLVWDETHLDQPYDVSTTVIGYRSERPYDARVAASDSLLEVGRLMWDEEHISAPTGLYSEPTGFTGYRPYNVMVVNQEMLYPVGGTDVALDTPLRNIPVVDLYPEVRVTASDVVFREQTITYTVDGPEPPDQISFAPTIPWMIVPGAFKYREDPTTVIEHVQSVTLTRPDYVRKPSQFAIQTTQTHTATNITGQYSE